MTFITKQFEGPISLSIFIYESEIPIVDQFILTYQNHSNLQLIFYIVPDTDENFIWIQKEGLQKQYLDERIFPLNLLRDLAILRTTTSHYICVDMDLLPSSKNFLWISIRPILSTLSSVNSGSSS
jgi:hypothetical protein